jgi:hypothetical protein
MRGDCPFCWHWWNWWPSLLLKVETDIIASISSSPKERALMLVIMSVETSITDAFVFIGTRWRHNVFHVKLTDIFSVSESVFNITRRDQRKNVYITYNSEERGGGGGSTKHKYFFIDCRKLGIDSHYKLKLKFRYSKH